MPPSWNSVQLGPIASETYATVEDDHIKVDAADFDTWGVEDKIHFIYQPVRGWNIEMITKIESLEIVNDWTQGGVMFRESLEAGSKQVSIFLCGEKGSVLRERVATNDITNQKPFSNNRVDAPLWLKLVRCNNQFSGYYSANGKEWNLERSVEIDMSEDFYAGLASGSHHYEKNSQIIYSNWAINSVSSTTRQNRPNFHIITDILNQKINFKGLPSKKEVAIYSVLGKKIATTTEQTLQINGLPYGCYIAIAQGFLPQKFFIPKDI